MAMELSWSCLDSVPYPDKESSSGREELQVCCLCWHFALHSPSLWHKHFWTAGLYRQCCSPIRIPKAPKCLCWMVSKYKCTLLKFNSKSRKKERKKSPVFIRKQSSIFFAESEYFPRFYLFCLILGIHRLISHFYDQYTWLQTHLFVFLDARHSGYKFSSVLLSSHATTTFASKFFHLALDSSNLKSCFLDISTEKIETANF